MRIIYDELVEVDQKLPPCLSTLYALADYNERLLARITGGVNWDPNGTVDPGLALLEAGTFREGAEDQTLLSISGKPEEENPNVLPDSECTPAQLKQEHPRDFVKRVQDDMHRELKRVDEDVLTKRMQRAQTVSPSNFRSFMKSVEEETSVNHGRVSPFAKIESRLLAKKFSENFLSIALNEKAKGVALEHWNNEYHILENPQVTQIQTPAQAQQKDHLLFSLWVTTTTVLDDWVRKIQSDLALDSILETGKMNSSLEASRKVGNAKSALDIVSMMIALNEDAAKVLVECDRGFALAAKEGRPWIQLRIAEIAADLCWTEAPHPSRKLEIFDKCLMYIRDCGEVYQTDQRSPICDRSPL